MASDNLQDFLHSRGIQYTLIEALPWVSLDYALTSAWVSREQLARTTILSDGLMLYLVVHPSSRKLQADLVGQKLRCQLRLASTEEIRRRLPAPLVQACPPIAQLCGFTVIVDRLFDGMQEVYFPAGSRHRVVRVSGADFMQLQQDAIYLDGISSYMNSKMETNKRMKQCQ